MTIHILQSRKILILASLAKLSASSLALKLAATNIFVISFYVGDITVIPLTLVKITFFEKLTFVEIGRKGL